MVNIALKLSIIDKHMNLKKDKLKGKGNDPTFNDNLKDRIKVWLEYLETEK